MKKSLAATLLIATVGWCALAQDAQQPSNQTYSSSQTMQTNWVAESYAEPGAGHVGVGLILGEPVGASVKYWLNDTMAIDGAIGWSDHSHSSVYFNADILWHNFDLIDISPAPGKLPLYFGVGGLYRARNDGYEDNLGVRAPVGVSYIFDNAPIDVFAEIAPAIDIHPFIRGEITGGIGVRFWF